MSAPDVSLPMPFAIAGLLTPKKERKRQWMSIRDARPLLEEIEAEKLTSSDDLQREAIKVAESDGIVFIDEIDKIVSTGGQKHYADASSEGVQRDLLPLIEGPSCSVNESLAVLCVWLHLSIRMRASLSPDLKEPRNKLECMNDVRVNVFRLHNQHQVRQRGNRSHSFHRFG